MKIVLRLVGLILVLAAVLALPARASFVTCYYFCSDGRHTIGATYEACCQGAPGSFPCPNGSQGSPYGYMTPTGPKFC